MRAIWHLHRLWCTGITSTSTSTNTGSAATTAQDKRRQQKRRRRVCDAQLPSPRLLCRADERARMSSLPGRASSYVRGAGCLASAPFVVRGHHQHQHQHRLNSCSRSTPSSGTGMVKSRRLPSLRVSIAEDMIREDDGVVPLVVALPASAAAVMGR